MKKVKKTSEIFFDHLKEILIDELKKESVKLAVRKLAVSTSLGQFVIKYIVEEIIDDYGLPMINRGLEKTGLVIDRFRGTIIVRKIGNAQTIDDIRAALDELDRL